MADSEPTPHPVVVPAETVSARPPGIEVQASTSADLADVTSVPAKDLWDTTAQNVIVTTEATVRNILHEHAGALTARQDIIGPFTLVVTILVTLAVGVKAETLTSALLIALGLALFWLGLAIRKAWRFRHYDGVNSIIDSLRPESRDSLRAHVDT